MPRSILVAWFATVLVVGLSSTPVHAAESPAPGGWPPDGTSTYTGTWTVVDLVSDLSVPVAQYEVGETIPGSLEVVCAGPQAPRCEFSSAFWTGTLTRAPDGTFRWVEEESQETGCSGEGLVQRTELDAAFEGPVAAVTVAVLHLPRTYTNDGCTAWATDEHWRFEGVLPAGLPSPSDSEEVGELERFVSGYGLDCAGASFAGATCRMQTPDGIYEVATRTGTDGRVVGIDASVTSLDESMPSDAGGFLRGVAQRAPVDDPDGLLAWFDQAIAGGAADFAADPWTGRWSDSPTDGGTVWALGLAREVGPAASAPATSAPAAPTAGPAPTSTPAAAPAVDSDGDGVGRGSQPFAASVPPPGEISTDPAIVLQSAMLAALLVFLMPFPGQLFNSTLETHGEEVRRWLRLDRLGAAARGMGTFWGSWPGVLIFTALAAMLYGFLDPTFGPDLGSLATFLGMLLGIVLVTLAFALPTVLAHRRLGDTPRPAVVPISLLVGVVCVLISRLTDFQPGYLYGLLIGFAFARELSAAEEGRATAIGAALMLGVAFIAWLVLGALPESDEFGALVVRTALAALMVAGLEGVVFGLLPMRFLPGEALYSLNRLLWAGLLLVGAFAFFHILINPASGYLSDTSRTPLFTVIALLVGFSLMSIVFWAWFRFRSEPGQPSRPEQENVLE